MSRPDLNRNLVVSAQPDDEVLGCSGTIAHHADTGDYVQVLVVAKGYTSRQPKCDRIQADKELSVSTKAAKTAGSILGAAEVELLNLPDDHLDSLDSLDLIKQIEERINDYRPQVIYVHHADDVNVDHRRLHEAVVTTCRPTPGQTVQRLLSDEVNSSSEWEPPGSAPAFLPNRFVDISKHWQRKHEALIAYESEMPPRQQSAETFFLLRQVM